MGPEGPLIAISGHWTDHVWAVVQRSASFRRPDFIFGRDSGSSRAYGVVPASGRVRRTSRAAEGAEPPGADPLPVNIDIKKGRHRTVDVAQGGSSASIRAGGGDRRRGRWGAPRPQARTAPLQGALRSASSVVVHANARWSGDDHCAVSASITDPFSCWIAAHSVSASLCAQARWAGSIHPGMRARF